MKLHTALVALASLMACVSGIAAPATYRTVDLSSEGLISHTDAAALWKEAVPAQLPKLYPIKKWGFGSTVSGGFTADKTCVVAAQAMLMPVAGKSLLYAPAKQASTFGSIANANEAQCHDLARTKLKEAINAINAALVSK